MKVTFEVEQRGRLVASCRRWRPETQVEDKASRRQGPGLMRAERKGERLLPAVFVTPPFGDRAPAPSPASLSLLIYYCRSIKSDAGQGPPGRDKQDSTH